jgi:2-hydroxychromene-2-carboxylate isomerase
VDALDVYFDYRSPFAYLAAEVLPGFADRRGLRLRWRPIDIMQLSNYADGLPYSPVKRRYITIDAVRSAELHGVAIRVPKPHPVDSATALRIALIAGESEAFPALHQALFRAAWRDQLDLSSGEVLARCIDQAGGPAQEWLARADEPEAAEGLGTRSRDAEAEGVFGVPTLCLRGELFWGLDSLPALEWRLDHPRADG